MSDSKALPSIILGDNPDEVGYVSPDNTKLLLDLTQAALQSQIEGVRQMFSRLGTVLAQASTLASASTGAVFWLLSHPVADRPTWLTWIFVFAALSWTASGALAVIGMAGTRFGAPGINLVDGYKQDVLSQSVREMHLWVIASHNGTLSGGSTASNNLRFYLNAAIACLVSTPLLCVGLAAVLLLH